MFLCIICYKQNLIKILLFVHSWCIFPKTFSTTWKLPEDNYIVFFLTFIYLFFFKNNNITLITAISLTSRLQKITYSTVTSIATLLTFFVFYKYVCYSAIQYLKQYWLKSD